MRSLELFSGSGIVSAVFREHGWETTEIDLLRGQDVRTWEPDGLYDFGWASPPCQEYSYVRTFNKRTKTRYEYQPDLSLWQRSLDLFRECVRGPTVIENVLGAQRSWGPPTYRFGPWCLWTDLLGIESVYVPGKGRLIWHPEISRTQRRTAVIPRSLAEAVYRAVATKRDPSDHVE